MKTKLLTENERQDWDRYVEHSQGVISWHVYDWAKVLKNYYRLNYFHLTAYDGVDVCGILPLCYVNTLRIGPALVSIPYVVAGGIVANDPQAEQCLLDAAIDLSKKMGSIPVMLKQYRRKLDADLVTDEGYFNRELIVSGNRAELFSQIAPENQKQLTAAESDDLQLEYPSRDIRAFYKLLAASQHRAGVPCPSRGWISELVNTGMYEIALMKRGKQVVAGTFAKCFKHTVAFPLTCLDERIPGSLPATYRLYWELIHRLSEKGITLMHSGRIPNSQEVPPYRLGWGGTPHHYYYQYHGYNKKTEGQSKRSPRRQFFQKCWRLMPRPVTGIIGPAILKQFP